MSGITRTEMRDCLAILAAGIGKPIAPETAEVWYRLLGDLPLEALQAAVSRAVLEAEYPVIPPVGRIHRMAHEWLDGIPETPEESWARVQEAVSRYGWPDPAKARQHVGDATWRAIQGIGGWDRICDSPIDQRQSLYAQYRDAWQRQSERTQTLGRLPESVRPRVRIDQSTEPDASPRPAIPAVRLLAASLASERDEIATKGRERLAAPPPEAPPPRSRDEQIALLSAMESPRRPVETTEGEDVA